MNSEIFFFLISKPVAGNGPLFRINVQTRVSGSLRVSLFIEWGMQKIWGNVLAFL